MNKISYQRSISKNQCNDKWCSAEKGCIKQPFAENDPHFKKMPPC